MADLRAEALSENQRGELVLTDVAHQLTGGGGGKPGQGYPAVLISTEENDEHGNVVDREPRGERRRGNEQQPREGRAGGYGNLAGGDPGPEIRADAGDHPSGLTVGSLFSGVGGMDKGLHDAGFQHVFFCESDEWRRSVLAHHWPGVPIYDDVRDVALQDAGGRSLHREGGLAEHQQGVRGRFGRSEAALDLLCGGFPCQDLSVAGNRAGLAGSRSGLFYEFARIIDALRPRWVLIENVPGLLSSNGGRDFGIVLGTLADLGYGVAWRTLDSRFFGVPQRRRRVFVLATVADGDPRAAAERAGEVLAVGSRCTGHPQTRGEARPDVASTLGGSVGNGRGHDGNPFDRGGHSSLSGLGNGGPDDNDAQAGRLVVSAPDVSLALNAKRGSRDDAESETFVTHALTSAGHDASEDGTGRGTPLVAAPLTSGGHPNSNMPGRRKEDDVNLVPTEPFTFDWQAGGGGNDKSFRGKSRAWIDDKPGTARSLVKNKTLAVYTPEEEVPGFHMTQDPISTAELAPAMGSKSTGMGGGMGVGVRRLTPTECERLQALPDGWTDHGPDSRRYSALGDAVTASVAEWIGRRLVAHAQSRHTGGVT